MIYSITPIKDSTLYDKYPTLNSGMDSILEFNYNYITNTNSRILLQFNTNSINYISASIPSNSIVDYELHLFADEYHELPFNFNILLNPVSQPWSNGYGKFVDSPISREGATWFSSGYENWIDSGSTFVTQSNINSGGGSWDSNYIVSQNINYNPNKTTSDLSFNITNIVENWLTGSLNNNGVILRLQPESNYNHDIKLQFFSVETNTIYQPKLFVTYNDSTFITGSLLELESDLKSIIYFKNLNFEYKQNSTVKLKFGGRNKYVQSTFNYNNHPLNQNKYLPINSYYSIKDETSGDILIDYNNYTQISCDEEGNFFWINMNNFNPERIYRILIKSEWSNGTIKIFDNQYFFKVIR